LKQDFNVIGEITPIRPNSPNHGKKSSNSSLILKLFSRKNILMLKIIILSKKATRANRQMMTTRTKGVKNKTMLFVD
jgi:hypothetical protein